MTTKSFRNFMTALDKGKVKAQATLTYDEMLKDRYIIVGSPETVRNEIGEYCGNVGAGGLLFGGSSIGPMPNWMVMKGMQMFSEEVMPQFRESDGKPDYLREEPLAPQVYSEAAARFGRPPEPARSIVTGSSELIDHRIAHLPEVIDHSLDGNSDSNKKASAG